MFKPTLDSVLDGFRKTVVQLEQVREDAMSREYNAVRTMVQEKINRDQAQADGVQAKKIIANINSLIED